MRSTRSFWMIGPLLCLLSASILSAPTTSPTSPLERAADQILDLPLDTSQVLHLSQQVIAQRDMRLYLEEGDFMPFLPLELDSGKIWFGGIFIGKGHFEFQPPISMERQQLRRFMKTDSLNRQFEKTLLMLDSSQYLQLITAATKGDRKNLDFNGVRKTHRGYLDDSVDRAFQFSALRSLADPISDEFMVALVELTEGGTVLYHFDPYSREQIGLYKREMQVVYRKVWQSLCLYPVEADTVALDFRGVDKTSLQCTHYDMDLLLKRDGEMWSVANAEILWDTLPARAFYFFLDLEMKVDSVKDANGAMIPFKRFKQSDYYFGLWLLFDKPPSAGERTKLQFFYHGDVAERELGIYIVFAGSSWYPQAGKWSPATYDIKMRSPSDYSLVASGEQIESRKVKDTLFSHWQVTTPSEYASFNIGIFERHQYEGKNGVALDVHFSDVLHQYTGSKLKQVVGDIQGSLEFYHWLYGPLRTDTIVVSEAVQAHSTSYPSFILMGVFTWVDSDMWGYERLHRSHETAHQWFGAGVGIDTYRDTWLSEGFAEYSSYMFLQAVAGNDKFMDRLNEHRKDILFERKNAGALALGPRSYNVKDEENYDIIVYKRGAFVLHMLRNLLIDLQTMKEDRFYAMMREFYATYYGRQVSTYDFQKMVEKHAGVDMGWFFRQWVYNNYIPTYDFSYESIPEADGSYVAKLHVVQRDVPDDFVMYVPVEIELEGGGKAYLRLLIEQPDSVLDLKLPGKPKKITFNPFLSVLADVNQ